MKNKTKYTNLNVDDDEKIKRLEEALEDIHYKFSEAETIASIGFWEIDPTTLNQTWTDGLFKIVGYNPEYGQINYFDQKKFIHPEEWDYFYNALQTVLKTGKDIEFEIRLIKPDGLIRNFHIIAKPKNNENGKVIGIRGTAQDITDLISLENRLKESEVFYRALFENTGTATIILDESLNIIMCNKQFEYLLGYSKDELEGKNWWRNFLSKEEYDRIEKYHKLRKNGSEIPPESYEIELIDKDGNIKIILITVTKIPGTEKNVVSLLDLTEKKIIEKELAKSERRYRYIVENATSGMFILDNNGIIKYLNEFMANILNYKVHEMLEKNIGSFFDESVDFSSDRISLENKIEHYNRFKFIDKDKNVFWTNLTVSPIFNSKHEYKGLLGILSDINLDKQLEETFLKREDKFTSIIYEMMEMLNNIANDKIESEFNNETLKNHMDN